jgi:hypothetical protein
VLGHGTRPDSGARKEDEMELTKAEIAMLQEALQYGIYHVRDGTAEYKQREAKINAIQALSRKLTQMAKEAEG